MRRSTPFSLDRARLSRLGLLSAGPRLVRSAGGGWERFFFLSIFLWAVYAFVLLLWATFSMHSSDAMQRVFLVFFSYMALVDAWQTPIMSASVLRASVGTGLNKSDENAMLFAKYLDSLGHGGHWRLGNLLSLVYFGGMIAWAFVALDFGLITGIDNFFPFAAVDTLLFLLLELVYRLLLKRLLRDAKRAGYPIQYGRRISS